MKKRLLALILSALLLIHAVACNTVRAPENDGDTEETNTVDSSCGSDTDQNETPSALSAWMETVDGMRYAYFFEEIDNNPYDKWLESELLQASRSESEIYSEYVALWETELENTVKNGKDLFTYAEPYENWTQWLKDWYAALQKFFLAERELLDETKLSATALLISYSHLIREETVAAKKVLYHLACENNSTESADVWEIPITWSVSIDQSGNSCADLSKESTAFSESPATLSDVLKNFHDNVEMGPESFFIRDIWAVSAEAPDALQKLENEYYSLFHFWELEYAFSVENGEEIFEDASQYENWKACVVELDEARQRLAKSEFCIIFPDQLTHLPQKARFLKQEVLELKFFLYLLEYQQKALVINSPSDILIEWSPK